MIDEMALVIWFLF